jgi:hypothetical protein
MRKPETKTTGSHGRDARVVHLSPARVRARAARKSAEGEAAGCAKCGSLYVAREPAFLHCRCCGSLSRIPTGSLLEQQLFEMRSGLRLAS